jgi:hypothetical protein
MDHGAVLEPLANLNGEYLQLSQRFGSRSTFWKGCYRFSWYAKSLLTWLTLLLAVIGVAWSNWPELGEFLLARAVPTFSFVGILLIGFELLVGPQHRWLTNRVAAQQLGKLAMLFRAGLPPFHDDTQGALLRLHLEDVRVTAGGPKRSWSDWLWQALDEYVLPAVPADALESLPDKGLLPPLQASADLYLNGRLRNQRQWYLRRAHECRRLYILILVLTGTVNAINAILW